MTDTKQPIFINKEPVYTYIAIPIEALQQTSEQGVQSLKVAQNVILTALPDGNVTQKIQPHNKNNVVLRTLAKTDFENKSVLHARKEPNMVINVPEKLTTTVQKFSRPSVIEQNKTCQTGETVRASVISTNGNPNKCEPQSSKTAVQKNQKEGYKCSTCLEIFYGVNIYKRHVLMHRNSKNFKCELCSASYNIEENLKIHMVLHNKGPSVCPICQKSFQRMASLKSHIILHEIDETFECIVCFAEFEEEEDFNKHIEAHKQETAVRNNKIPLVCSICSHVFKEQSQYKEHMSHHFQIRKMMKGRKTRRKTCNSKYHTHQCHICDKSFSKFCLLERHMRIHSGERPFKCYLCERAFSQKCTLQVHLARHKGLKPFACTLCPAKFCQKGNLRAHVRKTHTLPPPGDEAFKCTMCSCIFKRVSSLNTHISRVHAGIKKDDITDVMEQLKNLENRLVPKNNEPTKKPITESGISAQLKDISNSNEDSTIRYVKLVDSSIEGTVQRYVVKQRKVDEHTLYICSYCSKEFKKPSDLIRHIRTHTREKPFKCKECGQAFSLKSTLTSHFSTHRGMKRFNCFACSKSFSAMRPFSAHLKIHDKNFSNSSPTFQCNVCNKVLTSAARVKIHMDMHKAMNAESLELVMQQPMMETTSGLHPVAAPKTKTEYTEAEARKRTHKCQICSSAFTKGVHLKRHMMIHTGERKHKCEICSKSFYTTYTLNDHMKFHLGVKNFVCKICGKKFITNSILKRHMIIHSCSRPYICPYCNKHFKTVLLCRKHINVHKKEIGIQMAALQETNELSNLDIAKTVNETSLQNNLAEVQVKNGIFKKNSNNPEVTERINLHDTSSTLKVNVDNKTLSKPEDNSLAKVLFTNESGFIISALVDDPVQQITTELQNFNGTVLENPSNVSYADKPVDSNPLPEVTQAAEFINIDETIAALAQDPLAVSTDIEYPTLYINYDELQTLSTPNLYNTCYPQLKAADPLLMSEITDVQDPNILFSADPALNPIADIQLETPNLETLIPLSLGTNLGVNNLSFSSSSFSSVFPNVVFSSASEDNTENIAATLSKASEMNKKDQENAIHAEAGSQISAENFNSVDLLENDAVTICGINQKDSNKTAMEVNQDKAPEAEVVQDVIRTSINLNEESIRLLEEANTEIINKKSYANTKNMENPKKTFSSHNSRTANGIGDDIDFNCMRCKKTLYSWTEIKDHRCDKPSQVVRNSEDQNNLVKEKNSQTKAKPPIIVVEDFDGNTVKVQSVSKKARKKVEEHKCSICNKIFVTKNSYTRHMKVHKEKRKPEDSSCKYCGKYFRKPSDMARHVRTHTGERPFGCDICRKKFSLKSTLESHYRTHNPSGTKEFNCAVCNSYFSTKSSLKVHTLVHTGVKPFVCTMCPEKFRTSGHRKSHMISTHWKKNQKRKSSKNINNILSSIPMDLQTTLNPDHNDGVTETLDLNNFQLPSQIQLDATTQITQDQNKDLLYTNQPIQIDSLLLQLNNSLLQDGTEISDIQSFIQIDINNDGQITNVRPVLNNDLSIIESLGSGLCDPLATTELNINASQKFECDVCHKQYTTNKMLKRHKRTHDKKLFKCSKCDKMFITSFELEVHLKVHSGYRPFSCHFCSNTFTLQKHLKTHIKRIHYNNATFIPEFVDTSNQGV